MVRSSKRPDWKPWDIWTHGVSWSFVSNFLLCRKQCKLQYVDGWIADEGSHYLDFGSAFHEVMERTYRACSAVPSRKRIRMYLRQFVKESDDVQSPKFHQMVALAEVCSYHYFRRYESDFEKEWIQLEGRFSVPYTYPDGKVANLIGYTDMVARHEDKLILYDTKTRGEINTDDILSEFPIDFQLNLYAYGLWRQLNECPSALVLNVVRRPGHTWKKSESLMEYKNRVEEDIIKRPDHFFKRPRYDLVESDLQTWVDTQLTPIMEDIREWQHRNFACYANPLGLRVGRRKSDYYHAITQGDFSHLKNRKYHKQDR